MGKYIRKTLNKKSSFFLNTKFMFKLKIDLKVMLTAFAIGILLVYFTTPLPVERIKFPSPFNTGKVVYRDAGDSCYIYKANEVPCSINDSKPQPIQE